MAGHFFWKFKVWCSSLQDEEDHQVISESKMRMGSDHVDLREIFQWRWNPWVKKYQKMLMNLNKFSSFPPLRNLFYECHVVLVKDSSTDSKTASQWTWVGEKIWMDLGLFAVFARLPPRLWTTAQLRAHELDTFCRRFWSLLLARAAHVCFAETSSCFCYMLTKLGQGGQDRFKHV